MGAGARFTQLVRVNEVSLMSTPSPKLRQRRSRILRFFLRAIVSAIFWDVIVRNFGGNEVKILYKGKVAGDEIKFTREMQGGMMGGPGGGPGGPGGPGGGQGGGRGPGGGGGMGMEFVAKRAK